MNVIDRIIRYKETDADYASELFSALLIIGEEKLENVLNEAEEKGKKIRLTYPIPFHVGPSEPNGVEII